MMIPGIAAQRRRGGSQGGNITPILMANFDGTDGATVFADSGPNSIELTASGTISLQTDQARFGPSSLAPNKSGHIQGAHPALSFGTTGDFTVECWAYAITASKTEQRGVFQVGTPSPGPAPSISNIAAFVSVDGVWGFYLGGVAAVAPGVIALNQWYHLAVSRSNGVLRTFVNGILAYENVNSYNFSGQGFTIGTYYSSDYEWDGYIDEFRILPVGIYTAAFTPPTAPFPNS